GAVLSLLAGLVAASCTDGRATPPGPTTAGPTTTTPPAPGAAAPSTAGPPAAASDSTGAASAKAAPAAATAATTGTVDVGAGLADLRLIAPGTTTGSRSSGDVRGWRLNRAPSRRRARLGEATCPARSAPSAPPKG